MKERLSRTKVVVRRLPPALSQSDLSQQIDERFAGRYHWFRFSPGKNSLRNQRHSRAYIDFNRPEDVIEFAEFFDGHVFVNEKGVQYKTAVEYAPSQRAPKQSARKDGREGTICKDPDYLEFLKVIAKPVEHLPSAEIQLERREAEQAGAAKEPPIVTPLMEYVRQRRAVDNQGSPSVRKISRRSGIGSSRKPASSNTKRVSEKKKYVMKDKAKNTNRKDKSTFVVIPRHEDQLTTSLRKGIADNEFVEGSVSGIPVIADPGKKKILLLKGKRPETLDSSLGNSPVSGPPKQNQRREPSGRMIRNMLSNSETQQKIQILNSENVKRPPRPSNARPGINGHTSHNDSEGDRKKYIDEKFAKKDFSHNGGEKPEKRTRNKDRPDRGVWAPLRRSEFPELVSPPTLLLSEAAEGSYKNVGRRGVAHNAKDEGTQNFSDGKSSKRAATAYEKQVWVQKPSAGS